MKVAVNMKKLDVYVGDVIQFDGQPCMVIDMGKESDNYGILSLAEHGGGDVIELFSTLHSIDLDSRTELLLIPRDNIIITKKEGVEQCQF